MNTSHLPLKYGNATLTMAGWFLTIPSKKKDADNQDVFIASPIVITARFIDPISKVEKIILSDFNHAELIEEADILSSQKLPTIIKFGFNVNEDNFVNYDSKEMKLKEIATSLKHEFKKEFKREEIIAKILENIEKIEL